MSNCWNVFCIATDCDALDHVDATGRTWTQQPGEQYCPVHSTYDTCTERS